VTPVLCDVTSLSSHVIGRDISFIAVFEVGRRGQLDPIFWSVRNEAQLRALLTAAQGWCELTSIIVALLEAGFFFQDLQLGFTILARH
jgi:hypothetical protein